MKCINCGGTLKTTRETVKYDETLDVTLKNVEVHQCSKCGDREVVLPNLSGLHAAIAEGLIRKPGRLNHHEIRFLRKFLGGSSADFAKWIGATPSTVSRWENGATPMGPTAERTLRAMVAMGGRFSDYTFEDLAVVEEEPKKPKRMRLALSKGAWSPEAQA